MSGQSDQATIDFCHLQLLHVAKSFLQEILAYVATGKGCQSLITYHGSNDAPAVMWCPASCGSWLLDVCHSVMLRIDD